MKKLTTIIILLGLIALGRAQAKDYPQSLAGLKQKLESELKAKKIDTINNADLYLEAMARISSAQQVLQADPKSKEAAPMFTVCSLYVEAALLQIQKRGVEQDISGLHKKKDEVLTKLNDVHVAITEVERSYGTKLRADLTEAKQNAEKEKQEAAEKLRQLEEEAERIRQEANQRFQELQGKLIQVTRDARGTIISMSDILFAIGKADLTPDLKTSLAKIAGILMVYKKSRIIVEGHTDNTGSAEFNQKLSEHRANNVMQFLIEQGVGGDRLTAVGWGMTKPMADNTTKEGRQKNRRVDLVIQDSAE